MTVATPAYVPQVSDSNSQQRVNLYNQLNQQQQYLPAPVVSTPGTTTNTNPTGIGTNGTYDYQTAIKDRLSAIGSVGSNALTIAQARQKQLDAKRVASIPGVGGNTPINYAGPTGNSERDKIVRYAEQFRGMYYKWGGSNPSTSFDCSGLVQYVYKKFGLNLPRISNQQAMVGRRTNIGNLKPGDLVAWDDSSRNQGADHIAIYVGNGYIMEAPHTGAQLRVRRLGNGGFDSTAWGVSLSQYLG